jgi:hypothetical protein
VALASRTSQLRHNGLDGEAWCGQGPECERKALRKKAGTVCDSCVMAEHAAKSHPRSDSRARLPLELVYSGLMGPFDTESAGGNRQILTAIDDFSGMAAVTPHKHKSEAFAALTTIFNR